MLETLISSKTRLKLLIKFFLNPNSSAHLRYLSNEFGESTNSIRIELNRFEKAGMLHSKSEGNRKVYQAKKTHPLFTELHNIVLKHTGLDQIIVNVIDRLGEIEKVYLSGDLAKGIDAQVLDLVFIGEPDKKYLIELIEKAEEITSRKIRYIIYSKEEIESISFAPEQYLILWNNEN